MDRHPTAAPLSDEAWLSRAADACADYLACAPITRVVAHFTDPELLRAIAEQRDAELMCSLARQRYSHPGCREHWRRAFVGLTLEEAFGGGTMDMGPDERAYGAKHQGVRNSWSGD